MSRMRSELNKMSTSEIVPRYFASSVQCRLRQFRLPEGTAGEVGIHQPPRPATGTSTPKRCHPERSEGSAAALERLAGAFLPASDHLATMIVRHHLLYPQHCHPERSEGFPVAFEIFNVALLPSRRRHTRNL